MSAVSLSDLRTGDLVRISRAVRVILPGIDATTVADEKNGRHYQYWSDEFEGSALSVELLRRPKKKPKVGDLLSAQEVFDTQWKRGTVLQSASYPDYVFILTLKGEWINQKGEAFGFPIFTGKQQQTCTYRVLHVVE